MLQQMKFVLLCLVLVSSPGMSDELQLEAALHAAMAKISEAATGADAAPTGFSLYVVEAESEYGTVVGEAAPDGTKLSESHMFRIASITKSYVATTALRLVELGEFDLSAPIKTMIDPSFNTILTGDGYDTDAITFKHVLSHTAGFYDHAQSNNFVDALFRDPSHVWTRTEQVTAGAAWGDPVGAPGEKFFYSDTGFVLLGHMIERKTGMPLPVVVRQQLNFGAHGLNATIWERGDSLEMPHDRRAHQYLSGKDTYTWDPSVDLYGGGGLVASMRDVAHFYYALLGGKIFDDAVTLETMLSPAGLPENSPYRLGIFEKTYDGIRVYEHGGFWGTLVLYDPETKVAIAGAALQQKHYPILQQMMVAFLKGVKE